MEIREIKIKEAGRFIEFFRSSIKTQFPEYSKKSKDLLIKKEWTVEKVKESLKEKYILYVLVFDKDKIVGYLIATIPFAGISSIFWLAVDEKYQGRGIATKIINKSIALLKKKGAHKVNLSVTNKKLIPFYEKLGFQNLCFVKKDYFGLDAYWMYKDIQKPRW